MPSKNNTLDAVTDPRDVEVDQESEAMACQFEVRQNLRLVNRQQLLNGLQFNEQAVLDQQVEPQPSVQMNGAVHDRKAHLALNGKPSLPDLMRQTHFIHTFEQPGPQRRMDGKRGIDYQPGDFIHLFWNLIPLCLCVFVVHRLRTDYSALRPSSAAAGRNTRRRGRSPAARGECGR